MSWAQASYFERSHWDRCVPLKVEIKKVQNISEEKEEYKEAEWIIRHSHACEHLNLSLLLYILHTYI